MLISYAVLWYGLFIIWVLCGIESERIECWKLGVIKVLLDHDFTSPEWQVCLLMQCFCYFEQCVRLFQWREIQSIRSYNLSADRQRMPMRQSNELNA
ncbi:hypothetical protein NPIL_453691 [Nephila pilipes]|uniref:Uncharacterized protein n=1 Tax=Nephila pilipes TaxID=299642 RepID=A0A8X6P0N7_NEPPI|nr:hypothetical protein NPIL_453691 [Nephila pilipes]